MHPPHPTDWIELRSDGLSAAIDPQGAQLSHLRDAQGRELLWNGDPAHWTGRAPILFPIVGSLNEGQYRGKQTTYALRRHGFARGRRFEVVSVDRHAVLMRLRDDEASRAAYPFAFELDVAFRVEGWQLCIEARVGAIDETSPMGRSARTASPIIASFGRTMRTSCQRRGRPGSWRRTRPRSGTSG